jgi:hypothetical protein
MLRAPEAVPRMTLTRPGGEHDLDQEWLVPALTPVTGPGDTEVPDVAERRPEEHRRRG